jgi:hypothetical protein
MTREERLLEQRLPFGLSQLVTVAFTTADTDHAVPHTLPPGRYRDVHYLPLRLSLPTVISTGEKLPEPGVLYLRSSVADTTATLLLLLPRDAHA